MRCGPMQASVCGSVPLSLCKPILGSSVISDCRQPWSPLVECGTSLWYTRKRGGRRSLSPAHILIRSSSLPSTFRGFTFLVSLLFTALTFSRIFMHRRAYCMAPCTCIVPFPGNNALFHAPGQQRSTVHHGSKSPTDLTMHNTGGLVLLIVLRLLIGAYRM